MHFYYSPVEDDEEALLKKLDELSISKPVKFNLHEANVNSVVATNMCSSSISEEDSGFLSSETPITKVARMF